MIFDVIKDAWKAIYYGVATEKQEKLVYNSHFYKLMMAWVALNDGHVDSDQMALLENDAFYKRKMANKAKKEGVASNDQLALLEKCRSGKNFGEYLEELAEFKKTHGHCDVPGDESRGLAGWVSRVSDPTYLQQSFNIFIGEFSFMWQFCLVTISIPLIATHFKSQA